MCVTDMTRELASKYQVAMRMFNLLVETFSEHTAFPGNLFTQFITGTFII